VDVGYRLDVGCKLADALLDAGNAREVILPTQRFGAVLLERRGGIRVLIGVGAASKGRRLRRRVL
jgi:hypothetical protein